MARQTINLEKPTYTSGNYSDTLAQTGDKINANFEELYGAVGGGGGGSSWPPFAPPLAADFNTCYASLRGGTTGNPLTMADDLDVGLTMIDASSEAPAYKLMGRAIPSAYQGATGDFEFRAKLIHNAFSLSNDAVIGMWVGTNSGKYMLTGIASISQTLRYQRASYNGSAYADGDYATVWRSHHQFWRIKINNQSTTVYVSADGKNWQTYIAAENIHSEAYTKYGFFLGRYSNNGQFYGSVPWFASSEYPA